MALAWVRLDANIAGHDKILKLLKERRGKEAAWAYVCSLGYCGTHGTDGAIPEGALPFMHATDAHAELLVKHGLWAVDPDGWRLPNWAERQELTFITEIKAKDRKVASAKANCIRHHGEECGCWKRLADEL